MKYSTFKLIEELDIDGDKNPDGFLINLCTLDRNNNIIYLKSKYITYANYKKLRKGGDPTARKEIVVYLSDTIKNPNLIRDITTFNKDAVIIIQNDKDIDIEKMKKEELKPEQLKEIARQTIEEDKKNNLDPEIKKQLIEITKSNKDDLDINQLKMKIETIDRENQNQKINDIKQMQMIQHMQLMNISSQNNQNNQNTFSSNLTSGVGTGIGLGVGMGLTNLLFSSFMYHPYYSYNYGFPVSGYYPEYYENITEINNNYYGDTYIDDSSGDSFNYFGVEDINDMSMGDFGNFGDFL
jgi:hypothetical protein